MSTPTPEDRSTTVWGRDIEAYVRGSDAFRDTARRVLDADALSTALGFRVELTRVHVKPGQRVLVSWRRIGDAQERSVKAFGYTCMITDPVKLHNARRKAGDGFFTVHREVMADTPGLFSGGLTNDPRLVKPWRQAQRLIAGQAGTLDEAEVLNYVPMRRVIVRVASMVIRVAERDLSELHALTNEVCSTGLPLLPAHAGDASDRGEQPRTGESEHVSVSPLWGHGDLAALAGVRGADALELAHAAGEAIARMHAIAPADLAGPHTWQTARLGRAVPDVFSVALALTENANPRVHARLLALRPHLEDLSMEGGSIIHGDLSPDQILVEGSDAGQVPQLRIIDFDRAGTGPAEADVGQWLASCESLDAPEMGVAFLTGYLAAARTRIDLDAVARHRARAHVAASLTSLYHARANWRSDLDIAVSRAERALEYRSIEVPALSVELDDASGGEQSWQVARVWPAKNGVLPAELKRDGLLRGAFMHGARVEKSMDAADERKLPAVAPALSGDGTVVSLRPGKRVVVRTAQGTFLKCVREAHAQGIIEGIAAAAPFAEHFRMPEVLRHGDNVVEFAPLAGMSMHDAAAFTMTQWSEAWEAVGRALARTYRDASAHTHGARVHDQLREERVLLEWLAHAGVLDEHDAGAAHTQRVGAVYAAIRALRTTVAEPATVIHRDLHDKQLFAPDAHSSAPGVLDVDTAAWGEAALDLGNLRAHARLRERQGVWDEDRARIVRDVIARVCRDVGADPHRVLAYERASLARLACVYAFRPAWRAHALDMARLASEL